ncbi:MAG: hypothetical protein WCK09_14000 [Bacteroidota bacterium]
MCSKKKSEPDKETPDIITDEESDAFLQSRLVQNKVLKKLIDNLNLQKSETPAGDGIPESKSKKKNSKSGDKKS